MTDEKSRPEVADQTVWADVAWQNSAYPWPEVEDWNSWPSQSWYEPAWTDNSVWWDSGSWSDSSAWQADRSSSWLDSSAWHADQHRPAALRPQQKIRKFCFRCRQRGHLKAECEATLVILHEHQPGGSSSSASTERPWKASLGGA